jgi:hypothetical protein
LVERSAVSHPAHTLQQSEFKKLCYDLGHPLNDSQAQLAFSNLDRSADGEITYDEVRTAVFNANMLHRLQPSNASLPAS